ncbi:unnamed protein product [Chrysoparadoxa australica]
MNGLRQVSLPINLVTEFERISRINTDTPPAGIETCGILAGKLIKGKFEVCELLIPIQTGTSDTCNSTSEEELFNEMLAKELICLGWIHSHPRQDCFLSSVDLHSQCAHQLMLPEAVAVVYAPRYGTPRGGVRSKS